MSLYSSTKGQDIDDIVFSIADQINNGIDNVPIEISELRIDIAKLNDMAGSKAIDCSDYVTARSYLKTALSMLPTDHWNSHYDLSLRVSLLMAKSSYSCGDAEKALSILQDTLGECQCIEDKLHAYFFIVTSKWCATHFGLVLCLFLRHHYFLCLLAINTYLPSKTIEIVYNSSI